VEKGMENYTNEAKYIGHNSVNHHNKFPTVILMLLSLLLLLFYYSLKIIYWPQA